MTETLNKAATQASMRSRMCGKCPLHPCSPTMVKVCNDAFVEGFRKGAEWKRKQAKKGGEQ